MRGIEVISIIPDRDRREVAAILLDIVGPERAEEVQYGTEPVRFDVPEDVAVEYQRRIKQSSEPKPATDSSQQKSGRSRTRRG